MLRIRLHVQLMANELAQREVLSLENKATENLGSDVRGELGNDLTLSPTFWGGSSNWK